jgi:NADH:ubiquinone oxidoreductase subunit E
MAPPRARRRNRYLDARKWKQWQHGNSGLGSIAERGERGRDGYGGRSLGTGVDAMSERDPETMSIFSPELATRFDALAEKYPVKRSALIPMLLYAQDEVGYLSDAVVAEVARRIGITELEVRNVATYYSMLRFKPAGKFNIQVCTNISCMLRGAYDVYERFQEELGVGPQWRHRRRPFFRRRGRMYRRVLLGARHSSQLRLPRRAQTRSGPRHSRAATAGRPKQVVTALHRRGKSLRVRGPMPRLVSHPRRGEDRLPTFRHGCRENRSLSRARRLRGCQEVSCTGLRLDHQRDEGQQTCAVAAARASRRV